MKPTFLSKVVKCIDAGERRRLIENTTFWIENLKSRIPVKIQMHNETIANLKKMKIERAMDKINIQAAIKRKENFKDLEIQFLKNAIKFNRKKIKDTILITDTEYCFKKNRVKWTMGVYHASSTFGIRKLILNEDEAYWNKIFEQRFQRPIYERIN
tara:strand:- start:735 stop:1202 length:468 start_codon:yes stop_codon:yes gene_type:complete